MIKWMKIKDQGGVREEEGVEGAVNHLMSSEGKLTI